MAPVPIQAAKSRPVLKAAGSAMVAMNADARYSHQPAAEFCLTACPDAPVIFEDLVFHHGKLRREHLQAKARIGWHTRFFRV